MRRLVVAEKPSVARSIAKALGADREMSGWLESPSDLVTWCFGHMLRLADADEYDPAYKKWSLDALPILPGEWRHVPIEDNKRQLATIVALINRDDVSELVCATDAGREGELIFRMVYKASGTRKPFKRLWISSLESAAIKAGFADLRDSADYDSLYRSALARSQADWLVGINATRLYTAVGGGGGMLKIGRVKTPTLAMIAERKRLVDSFKKETTWVVVKDFGGWRLETDRFKARRDAENALRLTRGKPVEIADVERAEKRVAPPRLHSLTSLQQEANQRYGMSAMETLVAAQSLYEKKLASYPRTDSNYLPTDMVGAFADIVLNLAGARWPDFAIVNRKEAIFDDKKVTDHYALILTRHCAAAALDGSLPPLDAREANVARLLMARMLAASAGPLRRGETRVAGVCAGVAFKGTGTVELDPGWKRYEREILGAAERAGGNAFPPEIARGTRWMAASEEVAGRETKPPLLYTENTLLGAMERAGRGDMPEDAERKGIGTSSTRAAIIEDLIESGYVARRAGKGPRYLEPTGYGEYLLGCVDAGLKDVKTTADWEWRLKAIERGEEDSGVFIEDIKGGVGRLVAAERETWANREKVEGVCPCCGAPVVDEGNRVRCSNEGCGKLLYKRNKFLNGRFLAAREINDLLAGRRVRMGLVSRRTGKPYKAFVSIDKAASTGRYLALAMDFGDRRGGSVGKNAKKQ